MQVKKSKKVVVVVAVKKSLSVLTMWKNPTDIEMSRLHKCTALKYANVCDLEDWFTRGCVYKTGCWFHFFFLAAEMDYIKGKVFPPGSGPVLSSDGTHYWDSENNMLVLKIPGP